jgi:hypothetical protein
VGTPQASKINNFAFPNQQKSLIEFAEELPALSNLHPHYREGGDGACVLCSAPPGVQHNLACPGWPIIDWNARDGLPDPETRTAAPTGIGSGGEVSENKGDKRLSTNISPGSGMSKRKPRLCP